MTDRKEPRGLDELEQEIKQRCPICAEGVVPEVRRDLTGALLWLHGFGSGPVVACEAADLQSWRAIARRSSSRLRSSVPGGRNRGAN